MASFPFSLPAPMVQGYGVSPVDKNLRTDMESGAARVRRRTAARLDQVDVVWRLRADEMAAFRAWFESRSDYNLIRWSEDLRNTADAGSSRPWSQFDDTGDTVKVLQVSASAPSGSTVSVSKLTTQATTLLQRQASQGFSIADGSQVCVSAYVKAAEVGHVIVYLATKAATYPNVVVNLTTGAATPSATGATGFSAGVVDVGNGWRRAWVTANIASGGTTPALIVGMRSATGWYQGAVGDGLLIWGGQVVPGAVPGPYLSTGSSGVQGLLHGADWFDISLPLGNLTSENRLARFVGAPQYRAVAGGLIWDVSAKLEVR